jgi:hypothetical protein
LEPLRFLSTPSVAIEAAMLFSKAEIEYVCDPIIVQDIKNNIRGGNSQCSARYVNKKSLHNGGFIATLDANGLYANAMTRKLYKGNLRALPADEVKKFTEEYIMSLDPEGPSGFFIKGSFVIPAERHDYLNDLPPLPERRVIKEHWLSEEQKARRPKHAPRNPTKLITTLFEKTDMMVDLKHLQLAIQLGVRVKEINCVYSFDQEAWLASYIMYMAEKRKTAKTKYLSMLFKLFCNSVYGNLIKRNDRYDTTTKICMTLKDFKKQEGNGRLKYFRLISDEMVLVSVRKKCYREYNLLACGFGVLEHSKEIVYDFFYNTIKPAFKQCNMIYQDTDSLLLKVQDPEWKIKLKELIKDHLDMSSLPKNHELYDTSNKSEMGKWSLEYGGFIKKAILLKPKTYVLILENDTQSKRGKGVPKAQLQNTIDFYHYERALFDHQSMTVSFNRIAQANGDVLTAEREYRALD